MRTSRFLLLSMACIAPLFAQERIITTHVIALDRNNQPVANLTADDFEIQEQGKPLRISLFRSIDPKSAAQEPLGPNEFSNRTAPSLASATVMLVDLVHPIDQRLARAQLTKAFAALRPDDHVYLYFLFGRGLYASRGLPEAGGQIPPTGPFTEEQIDAAFDKARKLNVGFENEDMFEMTYQALQSLASRLAGLPGRKSIVWISSGIPTSIESGQPGYSRDYSGYENRLTAALQRGNVAMYPIGDSRRQIGTAGMSMMNEIAERSGGRARMEMDVASSLQQAMQDSQSSYTLGFSPRVWDGKYHRVRIACTKSGVRVIGPDGYYPASATAGDDEAQLIGAALWSPFDSPEIGLRASIAPSQKVPNATRFAVRIQTGDLQMMPTENGFMGELSVTFIAYDAAGKSTVVKQTSYPSFRMTAEQYRDALQHGTKVSPDLPLKDDISKVRIVVYDRYSGAIGSLTVPLRTEPRHEP